MNDIMLMEKHITANIEYPKDIFIKYFPKVCFFVEQRGTDITPSEIVAALDPIPASLPEPIRIRWEALHQVFTSNLALFRRELCHAEIFLGIYERLFAKVKRGGARPRKKALPS